MVIALPCEAHPDIASAIYDLPQGMLSDLLLAYFDKEIHIDPYLRGQHYSKALAILANYNYNTRNLILGICRALLIGRSRRATSS